MAMVILNSFKGYLLPGSYLNVSLTVSVTGPGVWLGVASLFFILAAVAISGLK